MRAARHEHTDLPEQDETGAEAKRGELASSIAHWRPSRNMPTESSSPHRLTG